MYYQSWVVNDTDSFLSDFKCPDTYCSYRKPSCSYPSNKNINSHTVDVFKRSCITADTFYYVTSCMNSSLPSNFYFHFYKQLFSLEMCCHLCHKAFILHTVLRGYRSSALHSLKIMRLLQTVTLHLIRKCHALDNLGPSTWSVLCNRQL